MALAWSRRVRGLVAGRLGRLGTTRRQFTALLEHAGHDQRLVDGWLPMSAVVLFAGHMIDLPGRPTPRLPEERCPAAAAAIRAWLAARDVGFGFSSAAGGGDILFQEALAAAGAERCVVLPFPEEEFLRTSVDRNGTGRWASRRHRRGKARLRQPQPAVACRAGIRLRRPIDHRPRAASGRSIPRRGPVRRRPRIQPAAGHAGPALRRDVSRPDRGGGRSLRSGADHGAGDLGVTACFSSFRCWRTPRSSRSTSPNS